jgi:hypothetical protein
VVPVVPEAVSSVSEAVPVAVSVVPEAVFSVPVAVPVAVSSVPEAVPKVQPELPKGPPKRSCRCLSLRGCLRGRLMPFS